MMKLPPVATGITFGTFFVIVGLVVYRCLWAAASFAGWADMLPKTLRRWQRWLPGEATPKKSN
jgi:hypothetical protein